jgi:hypothetical protein
MRTTSSLIGTLARPWSAFRGVPTEQGRQDKKKCGHWGVLKWVLNAASCRGDISAVAKTPICANEAGCCIRLLGITTDDQL